MDLTNGDHSQQQQQQQEAYCNLCERSFCNKYFLKTHLAKKHPELNLVSPLSLTENNDNVNGTLTSPTNDQPPVALIQSSPVNHKSNDKTSEDYCEVCFKAEEETN